MFLFIFTWKKKLILRLYKVESNFLYNIKISAEQISFEHFLWTILWFRYHQYKNNIYF